MNKTKIDNPSYDIVLIGAGNLGQHLAWAIDQSSRLNLLTIFLRNPEKIKGLPKVPISTSLEELPQADLYILAVNDSQISKLAQNPFFQDKFIVHLSGATPLEVFPMKRAGILYFLYSFSKGSTTNFKEIPASIETKHLEDQHLLKTIAEQFCSHVSVMSSKKRGELHMAAVFANNFTNFMLIEAQEICQAHDLNFKLLEPLVLQGVHKAFEIGPENAQTGPAIRNDQATLQRHEAKLSSDKRELYKILTKAIQDKYGKKL